ncbi:hypothetical protein [Lentzea kentuckyensis]|uniref:hypothetical protein n=1 Tax=Lentzea kentuckyensis TaxID=360086 RepID=UPI000A3CDAD9|nr:hypothetical protein [Lentzea kentuckyensis]
MRKAMAAALTGFALVGLAGTASAQVAQQDFSWPPKDITPIHKTKAELRQQADEFTAHQRQSYPAIFPDARFVTPNLWGGLRDDVFDDDMQYMANLVKFRNPSEWTNVITQVHAPGFFTESPEQLCERQKCTSTVSDSKGGVTVFSGPDEYREVVVTNYRPNGEVVFVQGSTEQEPAQLAAVAEDRAYTFTR